MADISDPITLPCGLTLPNRLMKAALAEGMADSSHLPNPKHQSIYNQWGSGGWGAVQTGNVMVDEAQMGSPKDLTALHQKGTREKTLAEWKKFVQEAQAHGVPLIMQINHPGRQSPYVSRSGKALAPSAVPMDIGSGIVAKVARSLIFGVPQEMTLEDIAKVIQQFRDAGVMAWEAGFGGVAIHGAHGYLLTQFLSPQTNKRTDHYGGSPANRARIAREVIAAIRNATSPKFCIGIKINAADFQHESIEETLEELDEILQESVDFIEISGGTYERPDMSSQDPSEVKDMTGGLPATANTAKREAFFLEYAMEARKRHPKVALVVTGGFRTRQGMNAALKSGACDVIGIGRPSVTFPRLPNDIILNKEVSDNEAVLDLDRIKAPFLMRLTGIAPLTAGLITLHFQKEMKQRALAKVH